MSDNQDQYSPQTETRNPASLLDIDVALDLAWRMIQVRPENITSLDDLQTIDGYDFYWYLGAIGRVACEVPRLINDAGYRSIGSEPDLDLGNGVRLVTMIRDTSTVTTGPYPAWKAVSRDNIGFVEVSLIDFEKPYGFQTLIKTGIVTAQPQASSVIGHDVISRATSHQDTRSGHNGYAYLNTTDFAAMGADYVPPATNLPIEDIRHLWEGVRWASLMIANQYYYLTGQDGEFQFVYPEEIDTWLKSLNP